MDYKEFIYIGFLTWVYFEGFREYFSVGLHRYAFLRKNLEGLKEKNYNKYFLLTRFQFLFYPFLKYKVLIAISFFYLHWYVFHSLVERGDLQYLEEISTTAQRIGVYIAGFFALVSVFTNPLLKKEEEELRKKRRADDLKEIKTILKNTIYRKK